VKASLWDLGAKYSPRLGVFLKKTPDALPVAQLDHRHQRTQQPNPFDGSGFSCRDISMLDLLQVVLPAAQDPIKQPWLPFTERERVPLHFQIFVCHGASHGVIVCRCHHP
jgi:hypothetical protein